MYTLRQFRQKTKDAFDNAEVEPVFIKRGSKIFMLRLTPYINEPVVRMHVNLKENDDGTISPRDPKQPSKMFLDATQSGNISHEAPNLPVTPAQATHYASQWNEVQKHHPTVPRIEVNDSELACCKSKTFRCKHWQWNFDVSGYQNTLSSRTREAEL